MPSKDPIADIYRMMDEAGLDAGTLSNAKETFPLIVNKIRTKLAFKFKRYIEAQPTKIPIKDGDGD